MADRELNGWKEIAAYLGKAVRTAQRWEQDLGLPIRRIQGPAGEVVSASTHELDRWREEAARTKAGGPELRDHGAADHPDADAASAGRRGFGDEASNSGVGEAEPGEARVGRPRWVPAAAVTFLVVAAAVVTVRMLLPRSSSAAATPGASAGRAAFLDPGAWPTTAHDSRRTNQSHLRGVSAPGAPRLLAEGSAANGDVLNDLVVSTDGQILFGGCGWIRAINASGEEQWRQALESNGVKHLPMGITLDLDSSALVTVSECPDIPGGMRTMLYRITPEGAVGARVPQGASYAGPAIGPTRTVYTIDEIALVRAYQPWLEQGWATVLAGFSDHGIAIDSRGNLYTGSDGGRYHQASLWSLSPEGHIRWRQLDDDLGRPAIGADDTVYVAGRSGYLYAFSPEGTNRWRTKIGTISSLRSLAVGSSGTIYVKGTTDLVAVRPDGSIKWRFGNAHSNPDVASPVLDRDENAYAEFGDQVCSVTPQGRQRWCAAVRNPYPIVIGDDGLVLVVSDGTRLYAIADSPGK
jgi:outer membrane protein assembly factor BamB